MRQSGQYGRCEGCQQDRTNLIWHVHLDKVPRPTRSQPPSGTISETLHQSFGVGRTVRTSTNLQFLDRLETRQAIRHAIHSLSPGLVRFVRLRYGCYWRCALVHWRSSSFAFAFCIGRCLPKLELEQVLKRSRVLESDVEQVNRLVFGDVSVDTSGVSAWRLLTESRWGKRTDQRAQLSQCSRYLRRRARPGVLDRIHWVE